MNELKLPLNPVTERQYLMQLWRRREYATMLTEGWLAASFPLKKRLNIFDIIKLEIIMWDWRN